MWPSAFVWNPVCLTLWAEESTAILFVGSGSTSVSWKGGEMIKIRGATVV